MIKILLLLITITITPEYLKQNGIIVYFLDPGCPYCNTQTYIIRYLYQKGYNVIGIVKDKRDLEKVKNVGFPVKVDEGEAAFAEIQSVPTIGILLPKQREFYIISEGYISYKEFWKRIQEIPGG